MPAMARRQERRLWLPAPLRLSEGLQPREESSTRIEPDIVSPATVDNAALSTFTAELSSTVQESISDRRERIKALRRRERILFYLCLTLAVLSPSLFLVGIVIAVKNSHISGIITSAAGAIGGSAYVAISGLHKRTLDEVRLLELDEKDDQKLYRAIQLARIINDPVRQSSVLAGLAAAVVQSKRIELEIDDSASS